MKTKVFYLIVLIGLAYTWWSARFMGGTRPLTAIAWTIVVCLLALAGLSAAKRANDWVWICAGLGILVALCLPDSLVFDLLPVTLTQPLDNLVQFTLLMIPSIAFVVVALLLQSGLNLLRPQKANIDQAGDLATPCQRNRWIPVIAFAQSVFVLAKSFHSFYWFMVWDTTYDPLNDMWLFFFPIPAVLFSSFVLFNLLPGKTKLIGFAYLLLIPALMVISANAQSIDFRQLTEERAEQVSQAIETFHAREGRYPHDLLQLVPLYTISLSNPLILYGQDWCYDGGDDYYRLGYVNRDHWSAPYYGLAYKSAGKIPDLPSICSEEIANLEKRYPGFTGRR